MLNDSTVLEPLRLIDAVAAIEAVLAEIADPGTGYCPYPPALLNLPTPPAALVGFTHEELEEATVFLCRLGVLAPRPLDEVD